MRPTSDQRTLVNTAASLVWNPLDGDGRSRDVTGTVTVVVSSSFGVELVTLDATEDVNGQWTASLPATHTGVVDRLSCVWKVNDTVTATTYVEVVGGYVIPLSKLLALVPATTNALDFTDAAVIEKRNAAEDRIELALGWSARRRFTQELLDAPRSSNLILDEFEPRQVLWCQLLDSSGLLVETLTSQHLAAIQLDTAGIARRTDGGTWGTGKVRIGYVYGTDAPPADLADAAAAYAAYLCTSSRSGLPKRATSVTTTEISYTLAAPGSSRWLTGLNDVDEILIGYRRDKSVIVR